MTKPGDRFSFWNLRGIPTGLKMIPTGLKMIPTGLKIIPAESENDDNADDDDDCEDDFGKDGDNHDRARQACYCLAIKKRRSS